MAVVPAFTAIPGTDQAGMTAYYRAPGCNSLKIADVLPILSKINHYEAEYVIGEMLIWDTGWESNEPNNCAMIRVIVYNDGWMCAWFDKTTTNQIGGSGMSFVDAQTLSGWGTTLGYNKHYNGCQLKITGSTDPDCPVDTVFTIRNTDHLNGQIQVHTSHNLDNYHFNSGYDYNTEIYMSNGQFTWWGHTPEYTGNPPERSNRLYRTIYQMWIELKYSSNSTKTAPTEVMNGYAWGDNSGVWTDYYYNYYSPDPVYDFYPLSSTPVINNAAYYGNNNKFKDIYITFVIVGVGDGIVWEYWNGSSWVVLTGVDGTGGFTQNGHVIFDPPDNWATIDIQGVTGYYVRSRCSAENWSVVPKAKQVKLYIQQDTEYLDTQFGLYNFEFIGANYCLLCGKTIDCAPNNNYFYSTVLPGKIIYDNTVSCGYKVWTGTYINILLNGSSILNASLSSVISNGYVNLDLLNIIYSPGTQNVFSLYSTSSWNKIIVSSFLLVS